MGTDVVDRTPVVIELDTEYCHACGPGSKTKSYLFAKLANGESRAYCSHHGTAFLARPDSLGATIIDRRTDASCTCGHPGCELPTPKPQEPR